MYPFVIVASLMLFLLGLLVFLLIALYGRIWLRALLSGARVTFPVLVAMRLRGNPPKIIVDAYVGLIHAGTDVSLAQVESLYIANKMEAYSSRELIAIVLRAIEKQGTEVQAG
jgi:uncharacterized protein YqfA (UPF0365 family)